MAERKGSDAPHLNELLVRFGVPGGAMQAPGTRQEPSRSVVDVVGQFSHPNAVPLSFERRPTAARPVAHRPMMYPPAPGSRQRTLSVVREGESESDDDAEPVALAPPTVASTAPVDGTWEVAWDSRHNRAYYYHTGTLEVMWEKPPELAKPPVARKPAQLPPVPQPQQKSQGGRGRSSSNTPFVSPMLQTPTATTATTATPAAAAAPTPTPAAAAPAAASTWTDARDVSGRTYYWNAATGETSWTLPAGSTLQPQPQPQPQAQQPQAQVVSSAAQALAQPDAPRVRSNTLERGLQGMLGATHPASASASAASAGSGYAAAAAASQVSTRRRPPPSYVKTPWYRRRRVWMAIAGVLLLVGVAGVGIYFGMGKDSSTTVDGELDSTVDSVVDPDAKSATLDASTMGDHPEILRALEASTGASSLVLEDVRVEAVSSDDPIRVLFGDMGVPEATPVSAAPPPAVATREAGADASAPVPMRLIHGTIKRAVLGVVDVDATIALFFDGDLSDFDVDTNRLSVAVAVHLDVVGWSPATHLPMLEGVPTWLEGVSVSGNATLIITSLRLDNGHVVLGQGVHMAAYVAVSSASPVQTLERYLQDGVTMQDVRLDGFIGLTNDGVQDGHVAFSIALPEAEFAFSDSTRFTSHGLFLGVSSLAADPVISVAVNVSLVWEARGGAAVVPPPSVQLGATAVAEWSSSERTMHVAGTMDVAWADPTGTDAVHIDAGATLAALFVLDHAHRSVRVSAVNVTGEAAFAIGDAVAGRFDVHVAVLDGDVVVAATGVPVDDMAALVNTLLDSTVDFTPTVNNLEWDATVDVTWATRDWDVHVGGRTVHAEQGVSVAVTDVRVKAGAFEQAVEMVDPDVVRTDVDVFTYLPVYTPGDDAWELHVLLHEVPLSSTLSLRDTAVRVEVLGTSDLTIDVEGVLVMAPTEASHTDTEFSFSGAFSRAQQRITFAGGLLSPWEEPFGISVLDVEAADVAGVFRTDQRALDTLDFHMRVLFTEAPRPVQLDLVGAVSDDGVYFGATDIDLFAVSEAVGAAFDVRGRADLVLSTYDFYWADSVVPGQLVQRGLNVIADDVGFLPDGSFVPSIGELADNDVLDLDVEMYALLPVLGERDWILQLETDDIPLVENRLSLVNNSLSVVVRDADDYTIALRSAISVNLARDAGAGAGGDAAWVVPVVGTYSRAERVFSIVGTLPAWDEPLGMEWLSFGPTRIDARVDSSGVQTEKSMGLSTSAQIAWGERTLTSNIEGRLFSTGQFMVQADPLDLGSIPDLLCEYGKICVASDFFDDLSFRSADGARTHSLSIRQTPGLPMVMALATGELRVEDGMRMFSGLNFAVDVEVSGSVLSDLAEIFTNQAWNASNIPLRLGVSVPVFDVLPPNLNGFHMYLRGQLAGLFEGKPNSLTIQGVEIIATPFAVPMPSVSLGVELSLQLDNQPELFFYVTGEVQPRKVVLSGRMEGTIYNAFGINGFHVGDLGIVVGFGAPSLFTDLGLSAEITMGETLIDFDVILSDEVRDFFIRAEGKNLFVGDVLAFWNEIKPEQRLVDFDFTQVPDFGLEEASILFAPSRVTVGDTTYDKGMAFGAKADLFAFVMDVDVALIDRVLYEPAAGVLPAVSIPDIELSLRVEFNNWADVLIDLVKSILNLDDSDDGVVNLELIASALGKLKLGSIFSVNSVGLEKLSIFGAAAKPPVYPKLTFAITVFGTRHDLQIDLDPSKFVMSARELFDSLGDALRAKLPECAINANCPGKCDHTVSPWRCADSCAFGDLSLPISGCWKLFRNGEYKHPLLEYPMSDTRPVWAYGQGAAAGEAMCWDEWGNGCHDE